VTSPQRRLGSGGKCRFSAASSNLESPCRIIYLGKVPNYMDPETAELIFKTAVVSEKYSNFKMSMNPTVRVSVICDL
jgi:hypothetical protein